MTTRTLFAGGTVVSMDDAIGDLASADVLVEGDRIVAIGVNLDCDDAHVIDAAGKIVMPGLINAHIHTWQTTLRGIGGDWQPADYDAVLHTALAPLYTSDDLRLATLVGAFSQLDGGTTTIFDWCHNNPTPEHSDAAIDALRDAKIRAVFGHGTVKPEPKPGAPHYSAVPHPREEIRRLRIGHLAADDGLVTLAACILGPEYATLEVCRRDLALAREFGLLSSAHVWGHSTRRVSDGYRALVAEKLVGPDHNIVHGNYLDDAELDAILDAGASATSAPAIELRGHVRPPLSLRLFDRGGAPSIGVDCQAMASDRMLDALRFALQSHRLLANLGRRGKQADQASARRPVTAREVLRWGTINNARALRLDHRIGSLTPGKQADIIVVRCDGLGTVPARDPAQALLTYVQAANVETVMVAGELRKANGRLLGPAIDTHLRQLDASARRLLEQLPKALQRRCSLGPEPAHA